MGVDSLRLDFRKHKFRQFVVVLDGLICRAGFRHERLSHYVNVSPNLFGKDGVTVFFSVTIFIVFVLEQLPVQQENRNYLHDTRKNR